MSDILNEDFFNDIKSSEQKNNFDLLVNYLCSKPVYNYEKLVNRQEPEKEVKISTNSFFDKLYEVLKLFLDDDNYNATMDIINNRSEFKDSNYFDGFARIYDLQTNPILKIEGMHTYAAVSGTVHELMHLLQAFSNNNPPKQYNEVLSIFLELVVLDYFSRKNNNKDIFNNHLINRVINRMSNRVYTDYFFDDNYSVFKNMLESKYTYFLGFIYALRMYDLYKDRPSLILEQINLMLKSKNTLKIFLDNYQINLSNFDTLNSFYNICDKYEELVYEKYGSNNIHFVK